MGFGGKSNQPGPTRRGLPYDNIVLLFADLTSPDDHQRPLQFKD